MNLSLTGESVNRADALDRLKEDGVQFDETRTAYGFIARLSKFGGEAGGLAVRILGERWVNLSLKDSIRLSGARNEVEP